MPNIPMNFDGAKFAAKYSLDSLRDFRVEDGALICPSLPDLTDADLLDCVVDFARIARISGREAVAKTTAKNIPNWATWTQEQWATWRDANISAAQITAIGSLADAKVMLGRMATVLDSLAKMEIALRDQVWPDLPE